MPSELKVNKLSPYTGTTLTLGDSGDTVSTDAVVQASQFIGGGLNAYRNIIINGDMNIAQRGTTATGLGNGDGGYYTVDRWRFAEGGTPTFEFTMSQDTDVPTGQGFATSLKMDCTTAQASLGTDSHLFIHQNIEAQNLQYLKKGTANAESVTLSFWVKSNKTGTYSLTIYDFDNTRQIASTYTINSTNTWEKKTVTFAGDTTGTLNNDNGSGLGIYFSLALGTNRTDGTLQTTWGSYVEGNWGSPSQVNLADNTANEWYLTGVQLEAGTSASDFEFLPFDVNLQRCQRYYQKSHQNASTGYPSSGGYQKATVEFVVTMRSSPTLTVTDQGTGGSSIATGGNIDSFFNTYGSLAASEAGTFNWTADAEL